MIYDAIYTRQSVDRIDSISVESQAEFCRKEVTGEQVRIYTDRGYSGKNTDRPAFREMIGDIEAGMIRRVIVYRLDRISRSVLDFAKVIDVFQRYHVDFVSTMEKFDTGTPIGKAMLMIVMIFAQLERETIQQRVVDAYSSRSRRGFYMGGRVPYGFRLKEAVIDGVRTKMYEPVVGEAEIVGRIFDMYAEPQVSLGDVMRMLEAEGIVKGDGKAFSRGRIRDMVVNPVYVRADLELYGFFKDQGTDIVNPPGDFIGTNGAYLYSGEGDTRKSLSPGGHTLVIAPHEGLVDSDVWIKCRKKCLKNQSVAKPVKARATWLAGKIKCARCGYALTAKVYRCKTKADNRYYLCASRDCGFGSADADVVDSAVLYEIRRRLGEFEVLSKDERSGCDPEEVRIKCRAEEVEREIGALLEKIPSANETVMGYINRRVAELDGEKKELYGKLARIGERGIGDPSRIEGYMEYWDSLSVSDRITVVDALIERIEVSEGRVEIWWRV